MVYESSGGRRFQKREAINVLVGCIHYTWDKNHNDSNLSFFDRYLYLIRNVNFILKLKLKLVSLLFCEFVPSIDASSKRQNERSKICQNLRFSL